MHQHVCDVLHMVYTSSMPVWRCSASSPDALSDICTVCWLCMAIMPCPMAAALSQTDNMQCHPQGAIYKVPLQGGTFSGCICKVHVCSMAMQSCSSPCCAALCCVTGAGNHLCEREAFCHLIGLELESHVPFGMTGNKRWGLLLLSVM